jgi:hypothetical protein
MHPKALLILLLAASASACSQTPPQQPVVMDPNDIQISPYRHNDLPPQMLPRIRATTDTFETIDGISYEKAVDLYKRDLNPEENLVLWEEMAKAYKSFCRARCSTPDERMDVYRSLLLRSMFPEEQALARAELKVLSPAESKEVMQLYGLPPKPIDMVQGN